MISPLLRRTTAIGKALGLAVLVAGCAVASRLGLTRSDGDAEPEAAVAQGLTERLNYTVNITGVEGELLYLMQRSSLLQELIDRPPPTLGGPAGTIVLGSVPRVMGDRVMG